MGFWARSLVEVARRVLCTGEVPGVAFVVEVPEDFLGACLGVLGLMGTEATLEGGRGTKLGSRSGPRPLKVARTSGGGWVLMRVGRFLLFVSFI